jgi:hypothetical protein
VNLPAINLAELCRFQLVLESYERSYSSSVFAEHLVECARPVLPLLGYEGPSARSIFEAIDGVDALIARSQNDLAIVHLESARRKMTEDAAAAIAKVVNAARRIAEQKIDESIARAANDGNEDAKRTPTSLERELAASVDAPKPTNVVPIAGAGK